MVDEILDELIRYVFATLVYFRDLYKQLEEAKEQENIDEMPDEILNAWEKANKMRDWGRKAFVKLKQDAQ